MKEQILKIEQDCQPFFFIVVLLYMYFYAVYSYCCYLLYCFFFRISFFFFFSIWNVTPMVTYSSPIKLWEWYFRSNIQFEHFGCLRLCHIGQIDQSNKESFAFTPFSFTKSNRQYWRSITSETIQRKNLKQIYQEQHTGAGTKANFQIWQNFFKINNAR